MNHKSLIETSNRFFSIVFSVPEACVRVSDGVKFHFRVYGFMAVSFTVRWMVADPDYNAISLSMFTALLCIVLNETGSGSVRLAQQSNALPHPKFYPSPMFRED